MRVAGMLGQAGVNGPAQHSTLLALTGMAQRGAIELGDVTRTAMGPLQQRIALATAGIAPGDEAARASATQRSVLQTFAEMEVGRGLGMTPRNLGNATAALEGALQSDVTQQRMLTNIRNARGMTDAQKQSLVGTLFATDSHGRRRLRGEYQTTFGLAGGLTQAGLDTTQAQNIFAGGGHGNPMSLQANWRRTLSAFMGEGNESVARMMAGAGSDFTEEDVRRGAKLFGGSERDKLQRNEERQMNALTENTGWLQVLSNNFAAWAATNPTANAALQAGAGALGGGVLGTAGGWIGRTIGGAGRAVGGMVSAAGGGVMGLARVAGGVGVAALAGLGIGDAANRLMQAGGERSIGHAQFGAGHRAESVFNTQTWREFGAALREGFGGSPIEVRPHPHDVGMGRAVAATHGGGSGGGGSNGGY
jgi:hypothetical protein